MTGIDWPAGFARTLAQNRERTTKFSATRGDTTEALATEMERLGVDSWRAATGSGGSHTKQNGLPKYSANPDDPGFVLRWSKDGEQFAVACDAYATLDSNMRAALLWVKETRKRGDRPVETGEDEFAAARLPAGDEAAEAAPAPHVVLDVPPDASDQEVREAFRERMMECHPDHGGSEEAFKQLKRARDRLRDAPVEKP